MTNRSSSLNSSHASGFLSTPTGQALLLLGAGALAVVGALLLYPPDSNAAGWLVYLAAALLAALAFHGLALRRREEVPPARLATYASARRVALALLLLMVGLGAVAWAIRLLARTGDHDTARWLWLGGIGLALVGSVVLGALGPRPAEPPAAPRAQTDRRRLALEAIGFLALVALATWLRVYRINQMPPGIFVDETNAALDALAILEGRNDSPFGVGWFETPTMYAYYLVALFQVLGTNFVALKAASLIPAVLTVAAIYPLARLLFGVPAAFAVTFVLATNRWHMTMSRWGWNEVAPLLFMVGAVYFLVRGTRDRRASDFALGGLLLGLGHYTYLASRLVTLTVALYVLYRVLFERRFLRRHWRGLVLFALLYLAAFGPLLNTYLQNPFTFANRSRQVSILHDMTAYYDMQRSPAPRWVGRTLERFGLPKEVSLLPLQESVLRHLEMFHVAGDRNPRHNLPGAPMLDPITGSLLLLSLGYALWEALRPRVGGHRHALLLLWLFVPLLGGILTRLDEAPQAYRTLPVVGAVALLVGDATVRSARVFADALGERGLSAQRGLAGAAMAALLLWAGVLNYRVFFEVQARDGRVWQAFSPVETTVAAEVVAKMDDHSLYLSPRLYYFSPVRFLAYRSREAGGGGLEEPAYRLAEPVYDLPINDPFGQDALFLLDGYYADLPELFRQYYPGTRFEMVQGPGGQPLYLSVTVPGSEIAAAQGLNAEFTLAAGVEPVARPYGAAPRFTWPPDLAADADPATAIARWTGSLQIPASGVYQLDVTGPGRVLLDGQELTGPRFLGKGLYRFELVQTEPGPAAEITLSWQRPGQADDEMVPPNYFFRVDPPVHGLRGAYYQGELWEGDPVFTRVDPLLLFAWPEAEPWSGPFSVRWTGQLAAPVAGEYRFQLQADDGVRFWVDGRLVGESVTPDAFNVVDVRVMLEPGLHDVRIDFFQRAGGKALEFWWQPPGDHLRPVPPGVLTPQ